MLNCNRKDVPCYPVEDTPGAGIIMDVDLEQLIRESERLRICKAILHSKNQRDALEAVLTGPNVSPAGDDILDPRVPPEEANHA